MLDSGWQDPIRSLCRVAGGNCPFLVFNDANLEQAVDGMIDASSLPVPPKLIPVLSFNAFEIQTCRSSMYYGEPSVRSKRRL